MRRSVCLLLMVILMFFLSHNFAATITKEECHFGVMDPIGDTVNRNQGDLQLIEAKGDQISPFQKSSFVNMLVAYKANDFVEIDQKVGKITNLRLENGEIVVTFKRQIATGESTEEHFWRNQPKIMQVPH